MEKLIEKNSHPLLLNEQVTKFGCENSPSKGHRRLVEYCQEAPLPTSSLLLWGHCL